MKDDDLRVTTRLSIYHDRNRYIRYLFLLLFTLFSSFFIHRAEAQQRGKATFYSKRATGARTSDGSRLHHDSLTCAHRTHPFGTRLKVTNMKNGKSVIVRVNDRGPYSRGRIIDLSYRAAQELEMVSSGVAMVEIEVVNDNTPPMVLKRESFVPIEFDIVETDISTDPTHPDWLPQSQPSPKDSGHGSGTAQKGKSSPMTGHATGGTTAEKANAASGTHQSGKRTANASRSPKAR